MKKQEFNSSLSLNKSVISNFKTSQLKGGTIGLESEDRLNCETEDCTQGCATLLYTNCYQCPHTTC
ncbi:class I lanthipeptide [Kordia sp.]|uniref:class I lanthipeptide n=1 Tax=Kordia sp. TaxID=1965332 RepID=UPI003D6C00C7